MPQTVIGRDPELARIVDFLERVSDAARLMVIDGQAGIGKSTLWLKALETAADRGWRVISAQPTEVEASFAFAGIGDVLEATHEELLRRLPAPQLRALRVALLRDEPDGPVRSPPHFHGPRDADASVRPGPITSVAISTLLFAPSLPLIIATWNPTLAT